LSDPKPLSELTLVEQLINAWRGFVTQRNATRVGRIEIAVCGRLSHTKHCVAIARKASNPVNPVNLVVTAAARPRLPVSDGISSTKAKRERGRTRNNQIHPR
jgi:hypothetical protein